MKPKTQAIVDRAGGNTVLVSFHLMNLTAQEVCIAGSFNDWHPAATPMVPLGEGRWRKELTLAPGRYEYRFVVDGQWVDDPAAKELIPNSFGTANAVLVVVAAKAAATQAQSNASLSTRSAAKIEKRPAQRETCCA